MADVCCGRPLYDYGFLGMAKRWWIDMLEKLRPYYQAGIPMVVLEPSCWAASRMSCRICCPKTRTPSGSRTLTFTLSDFLRTKAPHYQPPKLNRKGDRSRPLPSESARHTQRQRVRQAVRREGDLRQMGIEHQAPRCRLLRHGRRIRVRKGKRSLRGRASPRRTRAAAGGSQGRTMN